MKDLLFLFVEGAIGYYGDQSEQNINEQSAVGKDFLADVVQQWEAEAEKANELGLRTVILRTG